MTHDVGASWRRRALSALAASLLLTALLVAGAVPTATAEEGSVEAKGTLGAGYWLVGTDGGIFSFGDADFFGSTGNITLNKPVVAMAEHPTGEGYWFAAADGGIFNYGEADFFGSTGDLSLNKPIVGMSPTPGGEGYYLVASDGGIFAFGDAEFQGSMGGTPLNSPIVAMAVTPSGGGYWLAAADGGIFAFGDAVFYGSMGGTKLNKPIVGMDAVPNGNGYYLVATDGGIFSFGKTEDDAPFWGSTGNLTLNQPIVDMALAPGGLGYWLAAADGGIFNFGPAAPFLGSMGGTPLTRPIVGVVGTPLSPLEAPDFLAQLRGTNEAGGAGDPDAEGEAWIDITEDELCYVLTTNFGTATVGTATAAHIHRGPAGQNGPVVITLAEPTDDGASAGCVMPDATLLADIADNPENYYVNVHNAEFPGGAARGQLGGVGVVLGIEGTSNFDVVPSDFPSFVFLDDLPLTGVGEGERGVGADYRPSTLVPYIVTVEGTVGRIYSVDVSTLPPKATHITTADFTVSEGAAGYGVDFNPVNNRLRIVNDAEQNFVFDPDAGTTTAGPALTGDALDIVGIAYSNNRQGATTTTLYGISNATDSLVTIDVATGAVTAVGPLGVTFTDPSLGFDIDFADADEPALFLVSLVPSPATTAGGSVLYALDPADGGATVVGAPDAGDQIYESLLIDPDNNG